MRDPGTNLPQTPRDDCILSTRYIVPCNCSNIIQPIRIQIYKRPCFNPIFGCMIGYPWMWIRPVMRAFQYFSGWSLSNRDHNDQCILIFVNNSGSKFHWSLIISSFIVLMCLKYHYSFYFVQIFAASSNLKNSSINHSKWFSKYVNLLPNIL